MSWRKYLVRGLVCAVLAGVALAGCLYQHFTNPSAVRRQVIAQLEHHFIGANVRVESARLSLFGGITLSDLRMVRRDDPDKTDLLYVPEAVIYHDKEQLLDGKLAVRKIELHRPRWRIIREPDGRWNASGILGPVDPAQPIPTIVMQHGTICFEDRLGAPGMAPVEIQDVNISMMNDPLPTLDIQIRGRMEMLGPVHAHASWQRVSEAVNVTVETLGERIGPALIQRLAAYCPELAEHGRQLEGVVKLDAEVSHDPTAERPWRHNLRCELCQGKLTHPQLPLPLEQLKAVVACLDGRVVLETLTARNGDTQLALKASACSASADTDCNGDLKVDNLVLGPDLFARLPRSLQELNEDFAPGGLIDLDVTFGRSAGRWRRHCTVRARDASARFIEFPYPLAHIKGTVEQEVDPARDLNVRRIDLIGSTSGQAVHLKGDVTGAGARPAVEIAIWGDNIPLDDKLRNALPGKYQTLAASFHPTGQGDFRAHIWRAAGAKCTRDIVIRFHDAVICYDVFRYPLENVGGVLEIKPDHWEFHDFHGNHKGGDFSVAGRSFENADGKDQVHIEIRGSNLLLDAELEAALSPKLKMAWKALAPTGRMNMTAQIEQLPGKSDEDIDVTVTARGCTIRPNFFPLALDVEGGTVHYAHNRVDLDKIVGRHGNTVLNLERGHVYLKPSGGFYAKITDLTGAPILPEAEFINALPPTLQKACRTLHLSDPIALTTKDLIIDSPAEPNVPPIIYWDGGLAVRDATLHVGVDIEHVTGQFWCRGRHNGHELEGVLGNLLFEQAVLFKQPLRDIHCHVEVGRDAPQVLRLPDLKARFFGGDLGGEARIEFGPTLHYELNLTALQVKLEDFGRHNLGPKAEWKGLATARLYLTGQGTAVHGLEGRGSIDVPTGQMYNLPLLLDLLKLLGLRAPDRTAFEEAHSTFSIKGPRVTVSRLDLYGNAISLSGQGEMNLDGSDVQLDFYAVWGRIMQVLPPLFRPLPSALSQQLLKIKMRGKMEEVKCTKEPVPILVEPLERLLKRMGGTREGESNGAKPPSANLGDRDNH